MSQGHDRSMAMLSTALEMEEKGKGMYERALVTCHQELGVKIFAMLKKDEDIHVQRIHAIYDRLKGSHDWSADWKAMKLEHGDLGRLFRDLANAQGRNIKVDASDLEALDVGLDFEFRSVEFYKKELAQATEPLEKEFIKCMVGEEESHHQALSDMKFFLSDPAAWFREHERTAFDGGTAMG